VSAVYTIPAYALVTYNDDQLINAARSAGFPDNLLDTMRCIAYAESSGSNAIQKGQPYSTTGWGCWQITPGDSVPSVGINMQLLDLNTNAKAAHVKWKSQGLHAWVTYTNGLYKQWENYHRGPGTAPTKDTAHPIVVGKSLQVGNTGPLVMELQRVLNAWYPWLCLAVDGIYGPHTAESVADFQKRAGFPVTGIADARSLTRLGLM